ncbi:MAG: translational GTPase TypA [Deltaproteobacteria bacterium]|nr:translational GTPase TypA [Deltaproteobacteria bacterium]
MPKTAANDRIRNIAIIAHVDHGKTTLTDQMFRQSGLFRDNQAVEERVLDSMDLERERGITIAAKNCSVIWKGVKMNIIDTPGHADFGGEVERALSMADGAVLLVDASEGPLPQTRFVLEKALAGGLALMVVVNKIDRADARPDEVLGEVFDLLIDLGASEEQIECPVFFAVGREGRAWKTTGEERSDLQEFMDAIVADMPAPRYDPGAPFQMLVSDLGYSDYLGRLAVGRVVGGTARGNDQLVRIGESGQAKALRVTRLQTYEGLSLADIDHAAPGDIIVLSGIEEVKIGDTICTAAAPVPLPRITVDEPTVSMRFSINTSPLAGLEGKHVTSSKIRDRLVRESLSNVAVRVEDTEDRDAFIVKGRGEFQMAIIIETMRREGFELTVGRPEVICRKDQDGRRLEPIEHLYVDCDEQFMGVVTEKLSQRKGRLTNMVNNGTGRVRMEFSVPSRGLIGYRDEFLTDTKGTGIMNSYLSGYEPHRGDFPARFTGSIVADRSGRAVPYALFNLEPRGRLFVVPNDAVYEGMIVGEHNRENDIDVNPCKEKKLTNLRASGKDEAVILSPVQPMTLERAIHFIREDEMVEVTPKSVRLRKVVLPAQARHQAAGKKRKLQE